MANDKKGIGCLTILLWWFFLPIMLIVTIVKSKRLSKLSKWLILGGFLFVTFIIGLTSQTDESIDDNSLVTENTINENNSTNSEELNQETFIISSIELMNNNNNTSNTLNVGETKTLEYTVTSNDSSIEDVKVQVGNTNIVKANIEKIETKENEQLVTVNVTAVGGGETKVFLSSTDNSVSSDISMITVREPVKEKPKETTKPKEDTSRTVYVTPSGKRYHYDSNCGGKNSGATTLNRAISSGRTPCQKCVH